ncbi:hypothetical protein [Streptomyces sp. NPDC088196]|uniref:hypothetical protein n=1 Tax=Streptomyces sp. NPDC088196 TaxID=3154868 RepID=UPI00344CB523
MNSTVAPVVKHVKALVVIAAVAALLGSAAAEAAVHPQRTATVQADNSTDDTNPWS